MGYRGIKQTKRTTNNKMFLTESKRLHLCDCGRLLHPDDDLPVGHGRVLRLRGRRHRPLVFHRQACRQPSVDRGVIRQCAETIMLSL